MWNLGDDSHGLDERRRRLVPQGLRAARGRQGAGVGGALRVGQLPHAGVAQRQAGGLATPAPTSRSSSALKRHQAARARTGWSCASTRAACRPTSRPPACNTDGVPTGGWWNYSGIQREVYLRAARHGRLQEGPGASRARRAGPARLRAGQGHLRNVDRRRPARAASPARSARRRLNLGSATISARRRSRSFTTTLRIAKPRLWSPARPAPLPRQLHGPRRRRARSRATRCTAASARSRSRDGRLFLNGQRLNLRGVGLHEDVQGAGLRDRRRVPRAAGRPRPRRSARRVLRTHYPLHPYTHELADRRGLLIWSEIPVYALKTDVPQASPAVRALAAKELEQEHRRQPEPPVGAAVVDRQRALLAARARRRRAYIKARGRARQGAGPDAAGRPRRRRLPDGRCCQTARTRRST